MISLTQTEIESCKVKALLRIASEEDVRYYLCGIYFDPAGYAVATDGHAMLAVRVEPFQGEGFIVPHEALTIASRAASGSTRISVSRTELFHHVKKGNQWASLPYVPTEGRYPDWRIVMPRACSGVAAWFDSEIVERLRLAIRDINLHGTTSAVNSGGRLHLYMNGNSAAVVRHAPDDVLAIIMPMRTDEETESAPDFVSQFLAPVAVKAAA